jgi:hypothetical protein
MSCSSRAIRARSSATATRVAASRSCSALLVSECEYSARGGGLDQFGSRLEFGVVDDRGDAATALLDCSPCATGVSGRQFDWVAVFVDEQLRFGEPVGDCECVVAHLAHVTQGNCLSRTDRLGSAENRVEHEVPPNRAGGARSRLACGPSLCHATNLRCDREIGIVARPDCGSYHPTISTPT